MTRVSGAVSSPNGEHVVFPVKFLESADGSDTSGPYDELKNSRWTTSLFIINLVRRLVRADADSC